MFSFIGKNPGLSLIFSFIILIIGGTILLKMPASYNGELSWLDSVFTATSATCVTGLIVKDTPVDFTRTGQTIILVLIQLGGLGIMTFSMAIAVILGKKLDFTSSTVINQMIDYDNPGYTGTILKKVISLTITVEIIGVILMIIAFNLNGVEEGLLFDSVFHCISAFCNAGFSTYSDSLMGFSDSLFLNLVVIILIICGGLGFLVLIEFYSVVRKKLNNIVIKKRFSVQLKVVLSITAMLILVGFFTVLIFEQNSTLSDRTFREKIIISAFQSVTARTAGFNTVDISSFTRPALLIFVVLMFIGAGPGGTAGGIKITTAYVFLKSVVSMVKSSDEVFSFGRKIPSDIVRKATAVFFISVCIICLAIIILSWTESFSLKDIIFETVSAFATVGLSTGITPHLSSAGRVVVIILMFVGRLGPVTLAVAISRKYTRGAYSLPEEKVMIG